MMLTIGPQELATVESLLARLGSGEAATLTGPDGKPIAVLVPLGIRPPGEHPNGNWMSDWTALAEQISTSWKSDRSATDLLDDMRR